jgi:hypothetical protein
MQLSILTFERYVDLFRQKVAKFKESPRASRSKKALAKDAEEEFDFSLVEEDEGPKVQGEFGLATFLRRFQDALPKEDVEKFQFLMEAHHQDIIQIVPSGDRNRGMVMVRIQGVQINEEPRMLVDFLEVFFAFSTVSKEIGISTKYLPSLMVDMCCDWFPEDALVLKLKTLLVSDAFFLLYSLASYVHAGQVRKIELPSFKKFISARDFLFFMQAVNSSTHPLLVENFWKLEKDMWEEELMISPASRAIRLILPEVDSDKKESFEGFELIPPMEIKEVSLRFSNETQASLDRLTNILQTCPTELWNTRRFGILLAGESGCGKSEYVLQLCRQLGFYCMSVGSLSSKWVGDTEKAISRVMEREYPRLMKEHNNKVILFLDEMDQLIGKKTEVTTHSSFHTNAGVSQILRSLDKFTGVIIGTLNVLDDSRLEGAAIRRFQHLVNFSLPNQAARREIWASREGFWQLAGHEALLDHLASYELSGSDIQSVCEKGFFLQYAGEEFAEQTLFDLLEEQMELGKKTRYQKSTGSSIGFQKLAS